MPEKKYNLQLNKIELDLLKLALRFLQANVSGAEEALDTEIYELDLDILANKVSYLDKK
jgi:hypothetical protein